MDGRFYAAAPIGNHSTKFNLFGVSVGAIVAVDAKTAYKNLCASLIGRKTATNRKPKGEWAAEDRANTIDAKNHFKQTNMVLPMHPIQKNTRWLMAIHNCEQNFLLSHIFQA